MSSVINVANAFRFDLTVAALEALGRPPLVAGDDQVLRFQIRINGVPQSLTGAIAVWTMRLGPGSVTYFQRSSVDDDIVFDADQDVEGEGVGLGWGGVAFRRADQTELLAFCGAVREHDLRVKLASDSEIKTYAYGPVEWLRPRSLDIV